VDVGHVETQMRFQAAPGKGVTGEVSGLLLRPVAASHLLVLAHGASTSMRHRILQTIADRLADAGIATFRYNFPYMEHGRGRDAPEVCVATVRAAVGAARGAAGDLPLLAGGHSFGGRMTSTAASESPLDGVLGLVFFAFPLHPPGRPDTTRADHLARLSIPMIFLSGTRDELAKPELLQAVCAGLGDRATRCPLETANHGFRTLKRSRGPAEDVFVEMARLVRDWASTVSVRSHPSR
jgi:uncharacterized protein